MLGLSGCLHERSLQELDGKFQLSMQSSKTQSQISSTKENDIFVHFYSCHKNKSLYNIYLNKLIMFHFMQILFFTLNCKESYP